LKIKRITQHCNNKKGSKILHGSLKKKKKRPEKDANETLKM
jgi:hypothetical protein